MTQPTPFTQEQLAWLLPRLHNGSSAVPQLAASLAVPSLAVPSLGGQSWGGPSASVAARATLPAFTAGHPVPGQTSGGIFLPPSLGSTIPPISFLSPNLGARFVPQVPHPAPIPSAGTVDAGSADAPLMLGPSHQSPSMHPMLVLGLSHHQAPTDLRPGQTAQPIPPTRQCQVG